MKKTTMNKSKKQTPKKKNSSRQKRDVSITISKKPLLIALISGSVLLFAIIMALIVALACNRNTSCFKDDFQTEKECENTTQINEDQTENDSGKEQTNENSSDSSTTNEIDIAAGSRDGQTSFSPGGSSSNSKANTSSGTSGSAQGSGSNQAPSQNTSEELKVGSSYMGGIIPRASDLITCFGPTLCGWFLDGSDYASIYFMEDYKWKGRFLDIVGGNLVTSEKNHWQPTNNRYFYSENLPKLFTNDMVEMAKKYGLRVINKKLYLTINGVTYSFHSGYDRVIANPVANIPNNSLSMPPNSQVDFDINVSPWFYDPEVFNEHLWPYIVNTNVISFVKLVKKTDGVMTLTLKSGNYPHGASTGIDLFGERIVVYITGR